MTFPVPFGRRCEEYKDENGAWCTWGVGDDIVGAMAHNNPFPGLDTFNANNLRLCFCWPSEEFNVLAFNEFRYS